VGTVRTTAAMVAAQVAGEGGTRPEDGRRAAAGKERDRRAGRGHEVDSRGVGVSQRGRDNTYDMRVPPVRTNENYGQKQSLL
jgi:hypothetical protein